MPAEFQQIEWNEQLANDWRQLLYLAVREDLDRYYDWTTMALVPEDARGRASIVARQPGVIAGLPAARMAIEEFDRHVEWTAPIADGAAVGPGDIVATVAGRARAILTGERTMLNVLAHLSGIATLTSKYVEAVAGTRARIYDTRKTTPGWRRLEKYAVRAGGGWNHRTGLYDAVLVKDNHLAWGKSRYTAAAAVTRIRQLLEANQPALGGQPLPVEIEVDTLAQLAEVLPERPDIVLLDNMPLEQLREAVALRDRLAAGVVLEASGGVTLDRIGEIARTGVDRISVGALTHSAPILDLGLDWEPAGSSG